MNFLTDKKKTDLDSRKKVDFKADLKEAEEFQDWVMERLLKEGIVFLQYSSAKNQINKGESISGIEVKYDMRFAETGNFYIETSARNRAGKLMPSGIYRNDNTWLWVVGNYGVL